MNKSLPLTNVEASTHRYEPNLHGTSGSTHHHAAGLGFIAGSFYKFNQQQRNGKVITFPVSDRKQDTLIPLIKLHTKKGSLYYTDDRTAYASLDLIGKHQIIAHRMEEYVREDTSHINGIEGFWSYAKTWLYHYRVVPKQYLHLYQDYEIDQM